MGLEELTTACAVPLSSMAESSPPSVFVQSLLGLPTGYYLGFYSQALGEYLLLLSVVESTDSTKNRLKLFFKIYMKFLKAKLGFTMHWQ